MLARGTPSSTLPPIPIHRRPFTSISILYVFKCRALPNGQCTQTAPATNRIARIIIISLVHIVYMLSEMGSHVRTNGHINAGWRLILSLSLSALHLTPVGWCHLNWTIGFHSTSLINVFWYQFDQSEPYQFESDLGERATFKCCQCEFWTHYKTPTSVCAQFDMHYVTLMVHRWYA